MNWSARKTKRNRECAECGWFLPAGCIGWWKAWGGWLCYDCASKDQEN